MEPICKKSGLSRRDGWIPRVQGLSGGVSRALYALWDPIFGHVAQEKFKIHLFRPARKRFDKLCLCYDSMSTFVCTFGSVVAKTEPSGPCNERVVTSYIDGFSPEIVGSFKNEEVLINACQSGKSRPTCTAVPGFTQRWNTT